MKPRVLYLVREYPRLSETYIKAEIEALQSDYDIFVISLLRPEVTYRRHVPYEQTGDLARIAEIAGRFRPHVLHAHYLITADAAAQVAARLRLPYTLRAHSFDALTRNLPWTINEYCLGILTFPFTRPALEARGVPPDKIIDCYPVIDYARFHDRSPNAAAVLNLGACLPKKRFEDYIALARLMPGRRFDLYPVGHATKELVDLNAAQGSPVTICPTVQPEEMPAVYKQHGWLVYTACPKLGTVGWPVAVAEAQAAGLGVCLPNIRPDLAEYLGGAGFLYGSVGELPAILSRPYPEEMRERGFEQARKSDVAVHKTKLTALWDKVTGKPEPGTARTRT